jgi:hypothetical protein
MGMQVYMQAFTNLTTNPTHRNTDELCHWPILHFVYTSSTKDGVFWPTPSSKTKRDQALNLRSTKQPYKRSDNSTSVIISPHTSHQASALCTSHTSHGPDFVSLDEQVFCDMTDRVLWPLCSATTSRACYDRKRHTIIHANLMKREMNYDDVVEWE